jgi:hypothetical protein
MSPRHPRRAHRHRQPRPPAIFAGPVRGLSGLARRAVYTILDYRAFRRGLRTGVGRASPGAGTRGGRARRRRSARRRRVGRPGLRCGLGGSAVLTSGRRVARQPRWAGRPEVVSRQTRPGLDRDDVSVVARPGRGRVLLPSKRRVTRLPRPRRSQRRRSGPRAAFDIWRASLPRSRRAARPSGPRARRSFGCPRSPVRREG